MGTRRRGVPTARGYLGFPPDDDFAWEPAVNLRPDINVPGLDAHAPTFFRDEETGIATYGATATALLITAMACGDKGIVGRPQSRRWNRSPADHPLMRRAEATCEPAYFRAGINPNSRQRHPDKAVTLPARRRTRGDIAQYTREHGLAAEGPEPVTVVRSMRFARGDK